MKWWYVLIFLIGVSIGWWILKNYGIEGIKKKTQVAVVEDASIQEVTKKLPTQFTADPSGTSRQTVEVQGIVQKWNPDTGIIEFTSHGKSLNLSINPKEATIFVPSLKNKEQELVVKENSGIRWETAFCKGDMVVVRLSDSKVVFISNNGYRSCGFKGE